MKRILVLCLISTVALAVPPTNICLNDTCPSTALPIQGVDASGAAVTAKPELAGGYVESDGSALDTTSMSEADVSPLKVNPEGRLLVETDHPNRFRCTVTTSTATTLQAVGGSCAAPGAGLSLYVTDIFYSSSANGIAADAFPTLKYGTGGTCGSGTTVFWGALTAAAIVINQQFLTPIKIPANNELCWITSTAGSKFIVLNGYIAP